MSKQQRPPAPQQFVDHAEKWTDQWMKLREQNRSGFTWYSIDCKTARDWALPLLHAMTQGHCAFCDTFPLADRTTEPIEHFRPKSPDEFAHLAFEWTNLYYSCHRCQTEKRELWKEGLIAPDEVDYTFRRFFLFDYTNGAIAASPRAAPEDQARAMVTIDLYGLDSPERRQHRLLELSKYSTSSHRVLDAWAYRDFLELA